MWYINRSQYKEIVDAIQSQIDHKHKIMESTLLDKISELVNHMTAYVQQSDTLFGSVDSKDMSLLVKNLADIGKIDKDKLMDNSQ